MTSRRLVLLLVTLSILMITWLVIPASCETIHANYDSETQIAAFETIRFPLPVHTDEIVHCSFLTGHSPLEVRIFRTEEFKTNVTVETPPYLYQTYSSNGQFIAIVERDEVWHLVFENPQQYNQKIWFSWHTTHEEEPIIYLRPLISSGILVISSIALILLAGSRKRFDSSRESVTLTPLKQYVFPKQRKTYTII